jgi:hypothetical protein
MPQSSAASRREDVDEVAACGLMGAKRRGGGAVLSWVKPTEAAGAAEEAAHIGIEGNCSPARGLSCHQAKIPALELSRPNAGAVGFFSA